MTFSYDDEADVLYLTFEDFKGKPTYIENSNGDILRIHPENGKIIGVTIPFFVKRSSRGDIVVPEIGVVDPETDADALYTRICSEIEAF